MVRRLLYQPEVPSRTANTGSAMYLCTGVLCGGAGRWEVYYHTMWYTIHRREREGRTVEPRVGAPGCVGARVRGSVGAWVLGRGSGGVRGWTGVPSQSKSIIARGRCRNDTVPDRGPTSSFLPSVSHHLDCRSSSPLQPLAGCQARRYVHYTTRDTEIHGTL